MGMETKHEAATHFVEAGLVLKREDPKGRHGTNQGIHDEIYQVDSYLATSPEWCWNDYLFNTIVLSLDLTWHATVCNTESDSEVGLGLGPSL